MKEQKVFTKRMAYRLREKGYEPIRIEEDPKYEKRFIYIYEYSPMLKFEIDCISQERYKERDKEN